MSRPETVILNCFVPRKSEKQNNTFQDSMGKMINTNHHASFKMVHSPRVVSDNKKSSILADIILV